MRILRTIAGACGGNPALLIAEPEHRSSAGWPT